MTLQFFYAHSSDNPDKSDWQLLEEHLTQVGGLAAQFAEAFGCAEYGHVAGLLHDLGKYTTEFQNRISGEGGRVDHATWGAKEACRKWGDLAYFFAYAIAGHHAGLANGTELENQSISCLKDRLARIDLPKLNQQWMQEILLPDKLPVPRLKPVKEILGFQYAFLIRMLFSCLVDADYLDTAAYYQKIKQQNTHPLTYPDLQQLHDTLENHLQAFQVKKPIDEIRQHILHSVQQQAIQSSGLFSLTVPTGGGKTLTSLSFALKHALQHGMKRIIYVIPFTSIIEQNAAVFRRILGEEAVLEHHSAFSDEGKASESKAKLRQAMENWDAPVIVTTAVQFFESLFANRPSKCRKLHNIANSVIILDEAQTLPLKFLRPCMAAISELARNYRCSVVLCTATQPALNEQDFKNGFIGVRELAPNPVQLYNDLQRVTVKHKGKLDNAEVISVLKEKTQVLCIVNNRLQARKIYTGIQDEAGAYHLTTLMCAKHRSEKLAQIREDLKADKPCRLVSTSLIEAGVDIDFPLVLRAEAGLDAIAQAAGRCNREGKRKKEESEVWIFQTDAALPTELKAFVDGTREVLRKPEFQDDPLSLVAIKAYFKYVYWRKENGRDSQLGEGLLSSIVNGGLKNQPFESVAAQFRLIESPMATVIIPYDNIARDAIRALDFTDKVGAIARKLQPYTVQIPKQALAALLEVGAVQAKVDGQFNVLVNASLYDDEVGLGWENPAFIRAEELVW